MESPEEPANPNVLSNTDIDKLTLELLVNKSKLQPYLAKSNPNEYRRLMERQQLYLKHKERIESFTYQLLEQHTRPQQPLLVSKDIQSVFDVFIDKCIYHFEKMCDIETEESHLYYGNSDDDKNDEDVMFGNCEDESYTPKPPKQNKPSNQNPSKPNPSNPKYTYPMGTLDMFVRRK